MTINLLVAFPGTSSLLRRQMVGYENLFSSVPLDTSLSYIQRVLDSLRQHSIPETRDYYDEICNTAILIIEQAGLRPRDQAPERTLSFVVNMGTVFQSYCYHIFEDQVSLFGEKTIIHQDPIGRIPLFSGVGAEKSKAAPDIVVEHPFGAPLPIEVKYKEHPERPDLNQAITYADAYQSKKVVLLCFSGGMYPGGWQCLGTTGGGIEVWIYRINLDSADIQTEERVLAEEVARKLRQ